MNKTTYLVLGSCFVLQMVPLEKTNGLEVAPDSQHDIFHHAQASELLQSSPIGVKAPSATFDRMNLRRRTDLELPSFIAARTASQLPRGFREQSTIVARNLIESAKRHNMDPLFLMALIQHESAFNPLAVGGQGEIGLMQIKPSTAQWLLQEGRVPTYAGARDWKSLRDALQDPGTNIAFGAAYLANLREVFRGYGPVYVSAYNLGAPQTKMHLRLGERPHIYSDRVIKGYVALNLDFAGNRGRKDERAGLLSHSALATSSISRLGGQTLGRH